MICRRRLFGALAALPVVGLFLARAEPLEWFDIEREVLEKAKLEGYDHFVAGSLAVVRHKNENDTRSPKLENPRKFYVDAYNEEFDCHQWHRVTGVTAKQFFPKDFSRLSKWLLA